MPGDAAASYSREEEQRVLRMEQQEAKGARSLVAFSSGSTFLGLPSSAYLVSWVYQFPIVAITNDNKLSDFKQHRFIVL